MKKVLRRKTVFHSIESAMLWTVEDVELTQVEFGQWQTLNLKAVLDWCKENISGYWEIGSAAADRPTFEFEKDEDIAWFLLKWG